MKSPILLALDTATEACSAALMINHQILERYQETPRQHAQSILYMIDSLLKEADIKLSQIDAIAFSRGPGAFTGTRIGAAATQGLAFGADIPVIPISTLKALAQTALDIVGGEKFLVAIDARMDEVYYAAYTLSTDSPRIFILEQAEIVTPIENIPLPQSQAWLGIGTGFASYPLLNKKLENYIVTSHILLPRASAIAQLALLEWQQHNLVSAEEAQIIYLRHPITTSK